MFKQAPFISYLSEQEKLSNSTINAHLQNLNHFVIWAKEQTYTELTHLTYTELLLYVQYCKQKPYGEHGRTMKIQTIKLRLNSLKKYYTYLKHIGIIQVNPLKKLVLKGEQTTITQNVFTYQELEQLYADYIQLQKPITYNPLSPYAKQRNNVILGLLLWQGVTTGELLKLDVEHLNLSGATIYLPKIRRGASRELKLQPTQILELHTYLTETRIKLKVHGTHLFKAAVPNYVNNLLHELKGIQPKLINTEQLRTSIIIHWLKVYDKRTAQYMAGHKHISSIERYERQELDSLSDTLLRHHPFA